LPGDPRSLRSLAGRKKKPRQAALPPGEPPIAGMATIVEVAKE